MTRTLVLHPPMDLAIQPGTLQAHCQELGLSGKALVNTEPNSFAAGDRYLDLMTFVGCSPSIHLDPDDASLAELSYVHFPEPLDSPTLRFGQAIQAPKCPNCKAKVSTWKDKLDAWRQQPQGQWVCTQCAHSSAINQLRWGFTAGVVSASVELRGIYPFEGIPTEQLLASLDQQFDTTWKYFYC